ncbi:hypothetical protein [Salmonella enterica]|uniref:hypothetical protein n=1 Tax=Salmonella enterica TaxID=28901 RepID=UPI003D76DF60
MRGHRMLFAIIWRRGLAGKKRWQWWRWIWGMVTGVGGMWRRFTTGSDSQLSTPDYMKIFWS